MEVSSQLHALALLGRAPSTTRDRYEYKKLLKRLGLQMSCSTKDDDDPRICWVGLRKTIKNLSQKSWYHC